MGYSHTWVKFYTDKKLTYQDAIKFAEKYPEKCIPFVPAPKAKSELDYYNENLDEYLSDPENEIDYAPEIFDFLAGLSFFLSFFMFLKFLSGLKFP